MKIIFDSEEQKEEFINNLVDCSCPSDIGLKDSDDYCNEKGLMSCYSCFEQSGLEMEVKV